MVVDAVVVADLLHLVLLAAGGACPSEDVEGDPVLFAVGADKMRMIRVGLMVGHNLGHDTTFAAAERGGHQTAGGAGGAGGVLVTPNTAPKASRADPATPSHSTMVT